MKITIATALSLILSLSTNLRAEDSSSAPKASTEGVDTKPAAEGGTATKTDVAGAAEYECSMQKAKRKVLVAYEKEGSKVPCKVNYLRDASSTDAKVIFNATLEEGYCEKKASEFVEKLKSSGWTCTTP